MKPIISAILACLLMHLSAQTQVKPTASAQKTNSDVWSNNWIKLINDLTEGKIKEIECIDKKVLWKAQVVSINNSSLCLDLNPEDINFVHGAYQGAEVCVEMPLKDVENIKVGKLINFTAIISEIKGVPRWINIAVGPNRSPAKGSAWVHLFELRDVKILRCGNS